MSFVVSADLRAQNGGSCLDTAEAPSLTTTSSPIPVPGGATAQQASGDDPETLGYNILTVEGGLYSFGDADYFGNLIDHGFPGPAVAYSVTP